MKKFSYILVLSLFAFFACQTDTVSTETEAFESDAYQLKNNRVTTMNAGEFHQIPRKLAENPEAYIASQLQDIPEGDEVRYGCVTFVDGFATVSYTHLTLPTTPYV